MPSDSEYKRAEEAKRGLRAAREFLNALPLNDGASTRAIDREFIAVDLIPTGLLAVDALLARISELDEYRTRSTLTRLDDAKAIGTIFDHSRMALEAAYAEFERAEEHHRWHHEQEGREVEEDNERLRVLMVIAEAIDELPEPLSDDAETQIRELRERSSGIADLRGEGGTS